MLPTLASAEEMFNDLAPHIAPNYLPEYTMEWRFAERLVGCGTVEALTDALVFRFFRCFCVVMSDDAFARVRAEEER